MEEESKEKELIEEYAEEETIDNDDLPEESESRYYRPSNNRFGQRAYNNTLDKYGIQDKNYYKNKKEDLKSQEEEALNNKNTSTKINKNGEEVNKNFVDKIKDESNILNSKLNTINNDINDIASKAYQYSHPLETGKEQLKAKAKLGITEFIKKNPKVLIILGVFFLIIFVVILIVAYVEMNEQIEGLNGYPYYENACSKVMMGDNLISIEEYAAGVVAAEVGGMPEEVLKTFAIAARTYIVGSAPKVGSGSDCYYIGDNVKQAHTFSYNDNHLNAANETKGLIIVVDEKPRGNYDASCVYTYEQAAFENPNEDFEEGNYYIKYGSSYFSTSHFQEVEADKAGGIGSLRTYINKAETERACAGNHGRGMSQNGAMYLNVYEEYDWQNIIDYYFDNTETIMTIYKAAGGYKGQYPTDPNDELYSNYSILYNESLESVLARNGSSVEELNHQIQQVVTKNGVGTRGAVVGAAMTLIGRLAEMGVRLNYLWGGRYDTIGVYGGWGTYIGPHCTPYVNGPDCYSKLISSGFDCAGFATWAFINGFQNPGIDHVGTAVGVPLSQTGPICQPGDTLVTGIHVALIVDSYDDEGVYIVAESTQNGISSGQQGLKLSRVSHYAGGYSCFKQNYRYGD